MNPPKLKESLFLLATLEALEAPVSESAALRSVSNSLEQAR
jgi:hypothetical protein